MDVLETMPVSPWSGAVRWTLRVWALLVLGFLFKVGILTTLGIVLLVIGAVLAILGSVGRPVAGRRHYY